MIEASFSVSRTLAAALVDQQLLAGLERVGTDREGGVLALLVLAQLRADAGEQHGEAERLGHIVVGAGFEAEDRVGIGVVAGQHDDRRLVAALAQQLDRLAPVHVGQADIHDQKIDQAGARRCDALGGGGLLQHVEFLVERKLLDQGGAQVVVIIDDQNGA